MVSAAFAAASSRSRPQRLGYLATMASMAVRAAASSLLYWWLMVYITFSAVNFAPNVECSHDLCHGIVVGINMAGRFVIKLDAVHVHWPEPELFLDERLACAVGVLYHHIVVAIPMEVPRVPGRGNRFRGGEEGENVGVVHGLSIPFPGQTLHRIVQRVAIMVPWL